jgi:predicted alpha/beta-hydrolase family hydrolase
VDIETPHGLARAQVQPVDNARGLLVLGHGAGGSVSAPDLMVATRAALESQVSVALVEQPYRVAGRKSQAPPAQLDAAWLAVVERLRADEPDLALIAGGRSAGARVACRTAADAGAAAVLCLAFPVHPPGKPEKSRLGELDAVQVPVLVIQGERDPFGMPPEAPNRTVVKVAGDHSLKADLEAVAAAIRNWL